MDHKFFSDFLREQVQLRGMSVEHLSTQSGVSERHLEALLERNYKKLPAAPYVRGYLIRIGQTLGVKGEELWDLYRRETEVQASGALDRLPTNRFAIKTMDRRWIVGGIVLLAVLGYLGVNASRLLGAPSLSITNPEGETTLVHAEIIMVAGRIRPEDKLTVDGNQVTVDTAGNFEFPYPLEPGLNQIEFTVKRILGRELTVTRRVVYEPPTKPIENSQ